MKTKTKNHSSKKSFSVEKKPSAGNLYALISESPILAEGDREFWLANYQSLPAAAQGKLAQVLAETTKEYTHETDSHMSRIAEITTKCVTKLTQLEKANEKVISARGDDDDDDTNYNAKDFNPDEILKELHNAGEF
jgi:hypothetical protein